MPSPPPFPTLNGRLFAPGDPLAGTLAPQGLIRRGMAEGMFDDVAGRGWTVLTFDARLAKRLQRRAIPLSERLGLSVIVLSENGKGDDVTDVTGLYRGYFNENGIAALMVRPDCYVHGAAADAAAAEALLDRLVLA